MFDVSSISWVAVIAAIVANMVLGFLWYGPLFGKQWLAAVGKKADEMDGASMGMYLVPVLATLVGAIAMWNIMEATGAGGLVTAFSVWLGFMALTSLTNTMFRDGNTRLWMIEHAEHLVGFGITGFLLDLL